MSELVCVRTFPSRTVAEVARALLESHEIAATVSAADSGYDVSFSSGGAKLLVNEDSVVSAEEILVDIQESSIPIEVEFSQPTTSERRRRLIWIGLVVLVLSFVALAF